MLVGAMNHPCHDVVDDIRWMAEIGLDFIDLTLEPPGAGPWQLDAARVRSALADTRFAVVGHTAYYLPLGHPFEEVRLGAVREFCRCIDVFQGVGAKWMNVHPDFRAPMHSRAFSISQNIRSLRELIDYSRGKGIGVMVENLPGTLNDVDQLAEFLDPIPELGLHLDVGHTNLMVPRNTLEDILARYADRLCHVHLHDNKGGTEDLHLPLGAGLMDIPRCVRSLKKSGYDGTITLEVFTPDTHFVRYSAEKLRRLWQEA